MRTLSGVKKVAALATSAAVALSGVTTAVFDMTGVGRDFFYDEKYNPIVQIAVGEKVMDARDFVAAGNIAAVIGNLAYQVAVEEVVPGVEVAGEVVLSTVGVVTVGRYFQDIENVTAERVIVGGTPVFDFYDKAVGLKWDDDVTFKPGVGFFQYQVVCGRPERPERVEVLKKGVYENVHCLLCETLCLRLLTAPRLTMTEELHVNTTAMRYYFEGLDAPKREELGATIPKDSISYKIDLGCIPTTMITKEKEPVDYEYRGKIIFLGEEYYVNDISPDGKNITLMKGEKVSVRGDIYTEYKGYKFKLVNIIYQAGLIAAVRLEVIQPDGTTVTALITRFRNAEIDYKPHPIEIAAIYAEEIAGLLTADLLVYDKKTELVVSDGELLPKWPKEKGEWKVTFEIVNGTRCGIGEYAESDQSNKSVFLKSITVSLNKAVTLELDETLEIPHTMDSPMKLTYDGYLTFLTYTEPRCSGGDDKIVVERHPDFVNALQISFTTGAGMRLEEVRLDEGPYEEGDLFLARGRVFRVDDIDIINETHARLRVEFMTGPAIGEMRSIGLTNIANNTNFTLNRLSGFPAKSDVNITLERLYGVADAVIGAYVFVGLTEGGEVYAALGNTSGDLNLTLNPGIMGTLSDFELGTARPFSLELVSEAGTDINEVNLTANVDSNDILLKFTNSKGEKVYVDFMDRNYTFAEQPLHNSIWFDRYGDFDITDDAEEFVTRLEGTDDELLITPGGGTEFKADWGTVGSAELGMELEKVTICQPMDEVASTLSLLVERKEAPVKEAITKEDETKEVTIGCCILRVEKFGVTVEPVARKVEKAVVRPVGRLVMMETEVDRTKPHIVIGGPLASKLAEELGLTVEAIKEDPDKYIVKKIGNALVVAGYTAEDTLKAADRLIEWIKRQRAEVWT